MSIKRKGKGFEFDKVTKNYKKFQRDAPPIVANNTLNWFLKGFREGGGRTDAGKWQRRKRTAKRDSGRSILVDTGALRRDVKRIKATFKEIIIGTTRIPYARRHNEGLTDKLGRRMPKREFIGDSKKLTDDNLKLINKMIAKFFR